MFKYHNTYHDINIKLLSLSQKIKVFQSQNNPITSYIKTTKKQCKSPSCHMKKKILDYGRYISTQVLGSWTFILKINWLTFLKIKPFQCGHKFSNTTWHKLIKPMFLEIINTLFSCDNEIYQMHEQIDRLE